MILLSILILFPPCHLFLLYMILCIWAIVDEIIKYIYYFIRKYALEIIYIYSLYLVLFHSSFIDLFLSMDNLIYNLFVVIYDIFIDMFYV